MGGSRKIRYLRVFFTAAVTICYLCIAKTPSGAPEAWLRCTRMPNNASMMNPSLLNEEKGNGYKSDDRHDRAEGEPRQLLDERQHYGSLSWRCSRMRPLPSRQAASRHTYLLCSPPTRGNATTFALDDGPGVTGLRSGRSLSSPKWQRSS